MKRVHKGKPINKFVGLKSKRLSMLSDNSKESNTAKGINIASGFKENENTLINEKVNIISKKISLSFFNDKRYTLNDGIHTLAYF